MTKPKRYKRYSSEFKREALLRASEEGMTDTAVCDELEISTFETDQCTSTKKRSNLCCFLVSKGMGDETKASKDG